MSDAPQIPAPPPLMDSPDATEIYASEVVGTGTIGNSVAISLATHRWVIPELGGDMQLARVVVARLVLSNDAAVQLSRRLAALARPEAVRQPLAGRVVSGQIPRPAAPLRPVATQPQRVSVHPASPRPVAAAATAAKPEPAKRARKAAKPASRPAAKAKPAGKAKGRSRSA